MNQLTFWVRAYGWQGCTFVLLMSFVIFTVKLVVQPALGLAGMWIDEMTGGDYEAQIQLAEIHHGRLSKELVVLEEEVIAQYLVKGENAKTAQLMALLHQSRQDLQVEILKTNLLQDDSQNSSQVVHVHLKATYKAFVHFITRLGTSNLLLQVNQIEMERSTLETKELDIQLQVSLKEYDWEGLI